MDNKYRPETLEQVIGLTTQIDKLKACGKKREPVLLLGAPGTGKTLLAELVCRHANMNVLDVHKENISQIDPFRNNITIESFFDKRAKAIVLDDVDILIQNDKITVSYLVDLVKGAGAGVFFIITCNINEEKKIGDLKKHVNVIRLTTPGIQETFDYITRILDQEKITYDAKAAMELVIKYKGNVRECFEQILHGTSFEHVSQFRNRNPSEIVEILLGNSISQKDACYLVDDEANIISCMYYENLPEEIHYNRYPKNQGLATLLYKDVVAKYIESTALEKFMHTHNDWFLWDTVYMLRFIGATGIVAAVDRVDKPKEIPLRMSQALSKVSHKQIMNKKMRSILNGFSFENKVIMADVAVQKTTDPKQRKKDFSADENNFINTYDKYFSK
jgi:adenylate kinase family enzyme